jgi:hypothetical protein
MKNIFSRFSIVFVVLLAFSVFLSNPVIAESTSVTIVGEVNDQYQIVTDDGTIYEIADTELGNELLQHIGEVAEVKGDIEEEDDVKVFDVKSFDIKEE